MKAGDSRLTEGAVAAANSSPRRPIWVKLLLAFLAVAGLMVAFAFAAISELRTANDRAKELVQDQRIIEHIHDLQLNLQRGMLRGRVYLYSSEPAAALRVALDDYRNWIRRTQYVAADAIREMPRAADADGLGPELASEIRTEVSEIKDLGLSIAARFEDGDIAGARETFETRLVEQVETLDRLLQTKSFRVRDRMNLRSRTNDAAYRSARNLVMSASGFAVFLALSLGLLISASIIRPLNRVRAALREVAGGNFAARADIVTRDELGELARSANRMTEQLGTLYEEVETQRSELEKWNLTLEGQVRAQVEEIGRTNRLRRFLPAQVADMIVDAPDEDDVLRTRRAEITVLFADLRGFTAFAASATPDQVVAALNTFHGTCGPLVEASGGTLERFLGDGLMVLFGAPVAMEDAAQRAVELAAEIRSAVGRAMLPFSAGAEAHGLGVGIGIGTGAATLGRIGFEGRLDYSAIGPAPNLAARLCDMAEAGQVLISHATAWQVECDLKPAGPFNLKGIGHSVPAFELADPTVPGSAAPSG